MMYMPNIFRENLMDSFFNDFDRAFTKPTFTTVPTYAQQNTRFMKTDIRETETGYELDIELPGYKKEELKLELTEGYLTVSAAHENKKEEKDTEGRLIRSERYMGSMQRSFYVGDVVTEEDIHAKFEDGILKLQVPKKNPEEKVPEKKFISIN